MNPARRRFSVSIKLGHTPGGMKNPDELKFFGLQMDISRNDFSSEASFAVCKEEHSCAGMISGGKCSSEV